MSDVILQLNNLNVEFPVFGGIFQRKIDAVHAVKNLSLDLDNKIKEIISLKDNILILDKENKRLKNINEKALEEINKVNSKLSASIKRILFKLKNNDFN